VKFNGTIFNRWGVEMFHWTNPAEGWDGKKGGKYEYNVPDYDLL